MTEEPKQYVIERVHRALAEDPRVGEGRTSTSRLPAGWSTGDVPTPERKEAISAVVGELLPEHEVCNETTVAVLAPVGDPEDIA